MNKLKYAFGAVPREFSEKIDGALASLDEVKNGVEMKPLTRGAEAKRVSVKRLLYIAVALVLVLGTALAVGSHFGILDFMGTRTEVGAQEEISKNIASTEKGGLRYTVREAVYDGVILRYVLAVEAVDSAKYVPVWEYNGEYEEMQNGETVGAYAARVNKEMLNCGFPDPDIEGYGVDTGNETARYEDETLVLFGEYTVPAGTPDRIQVHIIDPAYMYGLKIDDDDEYLVSFFLDKSTGEKREYEIHASADSPITLRSASRIRTSFADYFVVEYGLRLYKEKELERIYDADTTYYITKGGEYAHTDKYCMHMENACPTGKAEVVAMEKMPCPICVGGGDTFGWNPYWNMEIIRVDAPDCGIFYREDGNACLRTGAGELEIDVSGSATIDENRREVIRYVIKLDSGAMPEGELYFLPYDTYGNAYDVILLK